MAEGPRSSVRARRAGYVVGSSSPSPWARLRRIWRHRRILDLLVVRDLKLRYAGSALGYVWTILDPLLMSLVYWVVFERVFHRNAGPDFEPYLVYLFAGQLAWNWFNGGVLHLTIALREEYQLVRSSSVPRELWVLRVVAARGVEYLFGLPVLGLYAVCYAVAPTRYAALLPLAWLLEAGLLVGIGLILAPLTVLFNDLERIVPILLRVLFYASPVLYSLDSVPAAIRSVYSFDPVVGFLTLTDAAFFPAALHQPIRAAVLAPDGTPQLQQFRDSHGRPEYNPDGTPITERVTHIVGHVWHWDWVVNSAIGTLIVLAVGVVVFTRLERAVLKEI